MTAHANSVDSSKPLANSIESIQFEQQEKKNRKCLGNPLAEISSESAVSEPKKEFDTMKLTQFKNARTINLRYPEYDG